MVETEIDRRTDEASTGWGFQAISAETKLDIEIENIGRHRPTTRNKIAPLGTRIICDPKRIVSDGKWRSRSELVSPNPHDFASAKLLEDRTKRSRPFPNN